MAHFTDVSDFYDLGAATPDDRRDAVADAVTAIRDEHLIVIPTDTVYGIAADAFSAEAVAQLLATKGRSRQMPPPVLVADMRTVDGVATEVSDDARALMRAFWPGKLTVVLWAQPTLQWDLGDTQGTVAVRVPGHPVAQEVLRQTGPLAVSSANRTGQTAATTAALAQDQLGTEVSVYLEDGTSAVDPAPSTIVDCTSATPQVLRLGAVSVAQLRQVVPGLRDVDGDGPAETPASTPPVAGVADTDAAGVVGDSPKSAAGATTAGGSALARSTRDAETKTTAAPDEDGTSPGGQGANAG